MPTAQTSLTPLPFVFSTRYNFRNVLRACTFLSVSGAELYVAL